MSILDTTVPYSFDAQRTKPKMESGAKLEMLRRRSRIFSSARRPKRSQCSIFFSIQVSSTWVSATWRLSAVHERLGVVD
jgi:hypothetical protein